MMIVALAAAFALGLGLGAGYFAALAWNVRLYLTPGRRVAGIALHAARLVAIGVALGLAAATGAAPLLAASGGFLLSRVVATRPREAP